MTVTTIHYGRSTEKNARNNFLLEGVECYEDTQMKAYDITKLTAELKIANTYKNKIYCFVDCFRGRGYRPSSWIKGKRRKGKGKEWKKMRKWERRRGKEQREKEGNGWEGKGGRGEG